MTAFENMLKAWSAGHRRVEGRAEGDNFSSIRWYYGDKLLRKVATTEYYRDGHIHPEGCTCDALVHDEAFHEDLRRVQKEAEEG